MKRRFVFSGLLWGIAALGGVGVAVAQTVECCSTTFRWESGASESPPCSSPSVKICETGNDEDPYGRVASDPRELQCAEWTVSPGDVVISDCDVTPPGGPW